MDQFNYEIKVIHRGTANETAAILENLDIQAICDIEKFTLYPYARVRLYFYILRFIFQQVRLLAAKVYQSQIFQG